MKPYIEVADETQRIELEKCDKTEKLHNIQNEVAKLIEIYGYASLREAVEQYAPKAA